MTRIARLYRRAERPRRLGGSRGQPRPLELGVDSLGEQGVRLVEVTPHFGEQLQSRSRVAQRAADGAGLIRVLPEPDDTIV